MAIKDKSTLRNEMIGIIRGNGQNEITGDLDQGLRSDNIDSAFNLITDLPLLSAQLPWDNTVTYQIGYYVFYADNLYKALAVNSNLQPDINPTEWQLIELGGGSHVYAGIVWIDSDNGDDLTGVFGDITKPYATLEGAINATPTSTKTLVVCGGSTVDTGTNLIDLAGKDVFIDARGKDIVFDHAVFQGNTLENFSLVCNNLTSSGTPPGFFQSSAKTINVIVEDTITNNSNSTSAVFSNCLLDLKVKNVAGSAPLFGNIGTSSPDIPVFIDVQNINITGSLMYSFNAYTELFLTVRDKAVCNTGGSVFLDHLVDGSIIKGEYDITGNFLGNFNARSPEVKLQDVNLTATGGLTNAVHNNLTFVNCNIEVAFAVPGGSTSTGWRFEETTITWSASGERIKLDATSTVVNSKFIATGATGDCLDANGARVINSTAVKTNAGDVGIINPGANSVGNEETPKTLATLTGTEVVNIDTDGVRRDYTTVNDINALVTGGTTSYVETLLAVNWVLDAGTIYYQDVTHNLNTEDILIEVYDTTSKETVILEALDRIDADTVRVKIEGNTDEVRVTVFKAGISVTQQAQDVAVVNPSTPYVPSNGDVIDWDCSGGNKVVNLPDAGSNNSLQVNVSKSDATANTITINASGADLINGSASVTVTNQYEVITLFSTGARWLIK